MTLNCIHIFIVTGSFLYWCIMRPANQHFFIHSCVFLRILIISSLATFLVTNSFSVRMCREAVNQSTLSLLTVCRMWHCALALEHSERLRLQAYMWKRENCPLNYDVNNCVYNVSVNFDQIHAALLSIVYLVPASNACLRLDQISSPHLVSDWINL